MHSESLYADRVWRIVLAFRHAEYRRNASDVDDIEGCAKRGTQADTGVRGNRFCRKQLARPNPAEANK
jgi:hypothetical protein